MARNVPISSVYGDTGTVEATFTKDLNTLGNDPYVRVTANSGEFNLFQQMNLSDNFYDSRYEEAYVTQNSAGTGSNLALASLQFNTMGWVRADRMYLQIPVVMNSLYTNKWSSGARGDLRVAADGWPEFDIIAFWEYMIQAGQEKPTTDATNSQICFLDKDLKTFLANFTTVDMALMHIFNRIAIYGGNNNQPIGRTQGFFLEGLKTQMREIPWNENTLKILANWGLPITNLVCMSGAASQDSSTGAGGKDQFTSQAVQTSRQFINKRSPSGYLNPLMEHVPEEWIKQWTNVLASCSSSINGTTFKKIASGSETHACYNQTLFNMVLPLSYINNFFRHKTYIPPDFKFKIDIEGILQNFDTDINYNCPIVAVSNCHQSAPSLYESSASNERPDFYAYTAGISFSNIRMIYQQHTLRQPIQAQINEKWLSYPIVYNYETFEVYDIDNSTTGTSTQIVRDIAISQQRPTQLLIQIVDQADKMFHFSGPNQRDGIYQYLGLQDEPWKLNSVYRSTAIANGTWSIGSTPWHGQLNIDNCDNTGAFPMAMPTVRGALSSRNFMSRVINAGSTTQNKTSTFPQILTLSVLIGGRTQYYYKNDTFVQSQGNTVLNAYDVLIAEQDAENYKDYSTETNVLKTPLEYAPFGGLGAFMRITIAPGGYVNTAEMPTDLGATVIRVQLTLSSPLPANKKLQIVKKNPEQIAVDTNKNCTLIMWRMYILYYFLEKIFYVINLYLFLYSGNQIKQRFFNSKRCKHSIKWRDHQHFLTQICENFVKKLIWNLICVHWKI